ncbi:glycoside hydrolase family 3 N-terminal domain-containing protein [Maribellus maritimus]|uniref:glycoside hydrolase family 3 N-terminal domain-containing protein n=1 Tax=Maribellus maritimus TaxID=2870838 RepID=UPI001EE9B7E1|nr:glycoside hydrolase family 3 N-terminal domain-containing protein [Maribellus maritimus]MCG6185925.1 serine hydrolase [Maribellus maritimus]
MNKVIKIFAGIISLFLIYTNHLGAVEPPFLKFSNDEWVNKQLDSMTIDEKIAQLMMLTAYPTQNDASKNKVIEQIKKYKPGGVLVMQGGPVKTTSWINEFQENSKTPLLIAIDGEWGLSMRIDSTVEYPYAQAIGAVKYDAFVYQMGRDIGNQLKDMGIHMNFAPVADVNTNPENPVINFRSFGEDKKNVANKAWQVAKGMQDVGVIPVAKHFPGHGDTHSDSHKTLPVLTHSKERMDTLETFPFRYLAEMGISGIMSAHLDVPSLDDSGTPSSLSKKIITDYLKNEIGFSGFVVTDAINMQGVRTQSGNAELEALKAGNDLIEFVPDLNKAIESVKNGIVRGELSTAEIDEKCRKILALKRWVNLNEYQPTDIKYLRHRLHSPYFEMTNRQLVKGALTVLKNTDNILPVEHLDSFRIASISIGSDNITTFQRTLEKYTVVDHYFLPKDASERDLSRLHVLMEDYNLVIAGIQGINVYPSRQYGTTEIQRRAVSELTRKNNSIAVFFGNAYAMKHFENIENVQGLILAYQNNELTQELAAQLVFGANQANGRLPVTVDSRFQLNDSIEVASNSTLSYTIPEEVGVNSGQLERKIDSIALLGVEKEAYPGCQVLIAKDGKVIFHKCYGYQTYEKEQQVKKENLYDWASLTKVTGPLPALMKLVDKKEMNLDAPFSRYWADFDGSNKKNITVREVLAHQARLASWIPFWQMTLDKQKHLSSSVFKHNPSSEFNVRVSSDLYMNSHFRKIMYDTIRNSKLLPRSRYLYSGLSFYLYPDIISNITGESYEDYLKKNFYRPLGAYTITYNPYKYFPMKDIIPTEKDDLFRMETIRGYVHDEGAAMMGGISGNAGLFGTTNDLAKLFQMYLQKGYFGGRRYISEKTVNEFIRIQYPNNNNRRGLGFDKPLTDNYRNSLKDAYPAIDASANSFGHSGFTGTFAWADPDNGLLYIFMSNRVHPTRENQKLYQLNIRTAMHQAIYDCLKDN